MHENIEYMKTGGERRIAPSDFFQESTYITSQNKEQPCYLITKRGCDMVANKMTGQMGIAFTATYVNRFHDMERVINNHIPQGKELLALAVLEAQKTIGEKERQIEIMKPKALFADAVSASQTSIPIGELTKLINQNGIPIGQNRLFEWMR